MIAHLIATMLLTQEMNITERLFAFTPTYDIGTEEKTLFIARKQLLSLTSAFDFETPDGAPIAHTTDTLFSWGIAVDITDGTNEKIGRIEEQLFQIFSWSEYKLFNAQDKLIAIAKMNFFGTSMLVYHPEDPSLVYAEISRPILRLFRDAWTLQIIDPDKIDERLFAVLAVYQTDKDNRRQFYQKVANQALKEN